MKKRSLLFVVLVLGIRIASAQSDVVEFIKTGPENASKLMEAYLNPYALALGDGLNNGWYYTAETHERFGFDFSMSVSAVRILESGKTFDLSQLGLQNIAFDPSNSIAQTIAGSGFSGPEIAVLDPNSLQDTLTSFLSPEGVGMDIVPIPIAQLGIGLLPHTDILIRYVPKLRFSQDGDQAEDVRVGLIGLGAKHSFKDWIPGLKALPFDAAVFGSYSAIDANSGINFQLSDYGVNPPSDYVPDENQELKIKTNTMKLGLIVSKKVAILTFFGSIGHSQSKTTVDLLGRYPVITEVGVGKVVVEDEVDPIHMNFESSQLSLDAGVRMKLSFFNVFASISKAEYTSLNAGIALSVR
ncbi:DUF6588 family protein [Sunxiuqinia elliptica]|uniref:Outer membrane protein beta-barrel domain-containing protein n=1 Tax=Sunxiuqinia elliptica TaxID=655355 RepID=A0A4R6GQ14_9BACT|nr:DUF6588 family protein [Sunxiuqinia elliptica]TDN97167.1 hypothetical protein DET52_11084 [Sunxiuqinia elliptica]TDO60649.1 hypothetical protein DET65_2460 [Sunxiuqinia elliptica]